LFLNAAVDDGAVFYLNGAEIYRRNLPPGPVTHFTVASSPVDHATFTGPIPVPTTSLVRGANVLAVEVQQSAANRALDMIFGLELTARISPPGPAEFDPGGLTFNEISAAGVAPFQIELVNRGSQSLDVAGYIVQRSGPSPDAQFTLSSQTLAPGAFLVLSQSALGFGALSGDRLFLFRPGKSVVADAVEVHDRPRA